MTHSSTTDLLHARWTTRPPGLRLAGTVAPATHALLEEYLDGLPDRFPGRRILHLMLTAVHSLDLAGVALLLNARKKLRSRHIDLRLHLPPELQPTHGTESGPVYRQADHRPALEPHRGGASGPTP